MEKQLLTNGVVFKRTDNRWGGTVWYLDEDGERKRKCFTATTKVKVNQKITDYIENFKKEVYNSKEANQPIENAIQLYLEIFKFPTVERVTYDRCEQLLNHQIKPYIGKIKVGNLKSSDIVNMLNCLTQKGYAFSTVKQSYNLLNEYLRFALQEDIIPKNPMVNVPPLKKANFLKKQNKEILPISETITVFSDDEIEMLKAEALREYSNGTRVYNQGAAYILMINTGLRTAEVLGLLNSDIDLENKYLIVRQGVKEVQKRNGTNREDGREIIIGKTKTASSKRRIPLNNAAINAILDLRNERYFGEDSPLIADENGDYTKPLNLRKRYYRILKAAGIERKGLHSLRHTFATRLVTGVKQDDGTIKSLTPRQVADLLGHTTSEITELYYVKRNDNILNGITEGFEI